MSYLDKEKQRDYQAKWRQRRWAEFVKENGPCAQCGSSENLEVDHKDPSQKVSHRIWSLSKSKREAELAKCQVLCRVCHIEKSRIEKRKLDDSQVFYIFEQRAAKVEIEDADGVRERLAEILNKTVNVLRGEPPPLVRWSWHDVPERVAKLRQSGTRLDGLKAALDAARHELDYIKAIAAIRRAIAAEEGKGEKTE